MTNGDFRKLHVKDIEMALPTAEDMGFCSSEDYLENDIHSPTDSSDDSVEVKVSAISLNNKRKLPESRKSSGTFAGPLKKRMCLKVKAEISDNHPFRPWSPSPNEGGEEIRIKNEASFSVPSPNSVYQSRTQPKLEPQFAPYFRPPSPIPFYQQTEPVSLVKKRENVDTIKAEESDTSSQDLRVPIHPQIQSLSTVETERMILESNEVFPSLQAPSTSGSSKQSLESQRREQRNYKNMTRERRIEANARERTRVHTISAAFDTLRRSIPSYSHNQKLSKLSVLRIACSYIMTLSSIVDEPSGNEPSTSECVDMVSKTIQREGKLRKKKDDND
nr:protein atonal homolog 8 isoform X1 [Leptinotarsa decemlineata]